MDGIMIAGVGRGHSQFGDPEESSKRNTVRKLFKTSPEKFTHSFIHSTHNC